MPLSFPPRTSLLCGSGGRDLKKRGEISPRELFIGAKASCGSVRGRRKNNSARVARYLPRAVRCLFTPSGFACCLASPGDDEDVFFYKLFKALQTNTKRD